MPLVLVVDDSKFNRGRVIASLLQDGYDTIEAENGLVALDRVIAESPDVILSDLLMPELDGLGLVRELRSRQNATPVVVITADIQSSSRELCLQLGVTEFLNKPWQPEQVRAAVARALESVVLE